MSQSPRFQIEASDGAMVITATGRLSAGSIVEVVKKFYPGFAGGSILWDLSQADVSELMAPEFIQIAAAVLETTPRGWERRTAYVVADATAILSIWKYVSEVMQVRVPVEYRAFTSLDEALAWLGGHDRK